MFEIAVMSFFSYIIAKVLTFKYRFSIARIFSNANSANDELIKSIGENNVKYYSSIITLYDAYRVRFSLTDLFFRPSSSRESAIVFYIISISILAWWLIAGLPSSLIMAGMINLILLREYVSYWKDTYNRTINNTDFQIAAKELYDTFKPTQRVG